MISPSRYLERFKDVDVEILGGALLVEVVPAEEIKKGGIIIAQVNTHKFTLNDAKAFFVRVLKTGKGYYDPDTGASVPLDTPVGAILMVAPESVTLYAQFGALEDYEPKTIGLMQEGAALVRWKDDADYIRAFSALNRPTGEKEAIKS